jgi:hypothetical protein
VLGGHILTNHPAGLTNINLCGPVVVFSKLIPGQSPSADLIANLFRYPGVIGQRPHQTLLIRYMVGDDRLARFVIGVRVVMAAADVIGREGVVVVGVGLAVGHSDHVERRAVLARLEIAQEQFVARFVVVVGLHPRQAVLRHVGLAHA